MVRVWLFGAVRLQVGDGEVVVPEGQPAQRLLAYLALRGGMIDKRTISVHIWDTEVDDSYKQALRKLSAAFQRSNSTAGDDQLQRGDGRRERAALGLGGEVWVDAFEYDRLRETKPAEALELCREPFMRDIASPGPRLSIFVEQYQEKAAETAGAVAAALFEEGRREEAIELAELGVELAPDHEPAIERLVELQTRSGNSKTALAGAHRFIRRREIKGGSAPSVAALAERIEAGELAAESTSAPPSPPDRVRRPRGAFVGVAALLLAVAAALAIAVVVSDDGEVSSAQGVSESDSCDLAGLAEYPAADLEAQRVEDSPGPARVQRPIVMRSQPRAVEAGADGVWVAQSVDGSIWRIDPDLNEPVGTPFPVGGTPFALALARDVVWVSRDDGVLAKLDRESGKLLDEIPYGPVSGDLALGAGSIWVNIYDGIHRGELARIDPCTGDVSYLPVGGQANAVIYAYDHVWVTDSQQRSLHRVDPETGDVESLDLDVIDPQDLTAAEGSIWIAHYGPKRLTRVDPDGFERIGEPVEIGSGAAGLALAAGAIWVANYEGDSISRVDVTSLEGDPDAARVGRSPTDIAAASGRLWVTDNDSEPPTVTAVRP